MLTKILRFDDTTIAILRNQVTWSDDGLSAAMPQLDPKEYQKVKKAFEALGGKWNKRANATLFDADPRPQIDGLVTRGTLSVARDGFYRTPKEVVWRMLEYLPLGDFAYNTLEPEAGDGAIVEELLKAGIIPERLYCIEKEPRRCQILRESFQGIRVACGDFMKYRNSSHIPFERIIMNPPFEEGQDGEHVRKAYSLLSGAGKMAAILGEGIFFRDDRKSDTFRKWAKAVGAYDERLPENSFRSSGTNVNTRLLILEK